ncbi:hypothetical protein SNEBB_000945 [Seison nebaliae]|nr:hypothetical protein SNEBB_000945 [Seison nebaliae]
MYEFKLILESLPLVPLVLVTVATFLFIVIYLFSPLASPAKISLDEKHILITGGSKGIGLALGIEAAKNGANVSLLARNEEDLMNAKLLIDKHLHKDRRVSFVVGDVTMDLDILERSLNELTEAIGPIDILINNAGISVSAEFDDIPIGTFQRLFNVNVIGAVKITKCVLKEMRKRQFGRVVFVSSQAGQIGIYGYSAYSSTKFALRGLAESLQMENAAHNIRFTLAFPPDTDTPGFREEQMNKPELTKIISETSGLFTPSKIARQLLKDVKCGNFISHIGLDGFMLAKVTAGASPATSVTEILHQIFLGGIFRMIVLGYLFIFNRRIYQHFRLKEKTK